MFKILYTFPFFINCSKTTAICVSKKNFPLISRVIYS